MGAREFLDRLDVYAYFTASTYTEAFARAPLEALAAGMSVLERRSFEPLFGEEATYSDHAGVAHVTADIAAKSEGRRTDRSLRGVVLALQRAHATGVQKAEPG